jgi:hypothetical protein
MTFNELLPHLSGVRHTSRGILALCPSHPDRHQSLSVREGERGLLFKCWAGCPTSAIVAALGLKLCDLFYDAGLPRHARPRPPARPRVDRNQIAFRLRLHGDLLFLRSTAVLGAATNLTLAGWSNAQLDQALAAVAKAYTDRERADLLDQVAFGVRCRVLEKGTAHAA